MNDKLLKLLVINLFVLCFLVAAGIVIYFYQAVLPANQPANNRFVIQPEDLKIAGYHLRGVEGGVLVLGTLENRGTHNWNSVTLEAELFDAKGKFLNECTTRLEPQIPPGAKENFKLDCSHIGDKTFISISIANIRVIKADRVP